MRLICKLALAGLGAVALSGGAALAQEMHVMKVALPDGSTAHIRYAGDKPPQVAVVPVRQVAIPVVFADPFADMDRVFADMDRQMAAMMQQARTLASQPVDGANGLRMVSTGKLPAGTVRYSYVSTTSNGGCTQTVQYISDGSAAQPKVTSQSSGDCSALAKPVLKTSAPATPAPSAKTNARDLI
ncbi:hypothetical protein MZO42_04815 [Sphingomonas psychrotolerans]|uniref:Uncharacterized protein n=1 Tax=Sphingomonas psychrotolerans TaxID=1327635 RepID=A0ABU3N3E0_9SPHN|nr:hypothetical protein [Sphingomonas psychrotolerans]MDT8758011.1 hypothetical protein [Sphingomonas psychrotolerans]